jgi:hypothetical protein
MRRIAEIRPALVDDSLRDLRHGIRMLRRAPGFTAAALATLALGIGATAAIFSVVRTVMLEPLPYREPDRLVAVWETNRGGTVRNVIAPANFVAWRERTRNISAWSARRLWPWSSTAGPTRFQDCCSRPTRFSRWAFSPPSAAPTRSRRISAAMR